MGGEACAYGAAWTSVPGETASEGRSQLGAWDADCRRPSISGAGPALLRIAAWASSPHPIPAVVEELGDQPYLRGRLRGGAQGKEQRGPRNVPEATEINTQVRGPQVWQGRY